MLLRYTGLFLAFLLLIVIPFNQISTHSLSLFTNKNEVNKTNITSKKAALSMPLVPLIIRTKEKNYGRQTVEEQLLIILEQNVNFVRGSPVLNVQNTKNSFDDFVQVQENRIYFVEDVLIVNVTENLPVKYYSNPHLGMQNLTLENSTRCKYETNQLFYTPMKNWRYPVYKMTKMKHMQEFRLPGNGDDESGEKTPVEKITKTFEKYEKLKALYFNCPDYHDCEKLSCRLRSDEEIIAIKLAEFAKIFNSTTRILPSATRIVHKNHTFSVHKQQENKINGKKSERTTNRQCSHKLSETVTSRWLNNTFVKTGDSILLFDTIYESFTNNQTCMVEKPDSCCGMLCCVVVARRLMAPKEMSQLHSLTALWGIAAFIGAAATIGVVLCIANYISLRRNAENATPDKDKSDPHKMEVSEKMMANGQFKKVRRGPRLRS